jgi:hypothetical protein
VKKNQKEKKTQSKEERLLNEDLSVSESGRGEMSNPPPARSKWIPSDRAYRNEVEPEGVPMEFPEGTFCIVGMLEGHIAAVTDHFEGIWYCTYFDLDLSPLAHEAFKSAEAAREWMESQELDRVLVLGPTE